MSIMLSKKHGVNPAIPKCFFCLEDKNEIILAGRMKGDAEAPRACVWDMNPCEKCEDWMGQGVILISVLKGEVEPNPYRTGGWVVVRDDVIERIVPEPMCSTILGARWAFVPDDAWNALGLPRR